MLLAGFVLCCAVPAGCVRRRLTVRSNPPGALVYVDNYEIGRTPCSAEFMYYGTRQIQLVKDGFETLTIQQPINPPWYQIPPLDFISENLVLGEIRDERLLKYQLKAQEIVPTEQLLGRAENLRRGTVLPLPATGTAPGAPLFLPPPSAPAPGPPLSPTPRPAPLPPPALLPETLPPGGQPPVYTPPLPQ